MNTSAKECIFDNLTEANGWQALRTAVDGYLVKYNPSTMIIAAVHADGCPTTWTAKNKLECGQYVITFDDDGLRVRTKSPSEGLWSSVATKTLDFVMDKPQIWIVAICIGVVMKMIIG